MIRSRFRFRVRILRDRYESGPGSALACKTVGVLVAVGVRI